MKKFIAIFVVILMLTVCLVACNPETSDNTCSHTYSSACDAICNICSETRVAEEHVYRNDCSNNCSLCNEEREAPHRFLADCATVCQCGLTRTIETPHTVTDQCDSVCDACGEFVDTAHVDENEDTICDECLVVLFPDFASDWMFGFSKNDSGYTLATVKDDSAISGELRIPKTYEGEPVTAIGFRVFDNCENLTSVIIHDDVTTIDTGAFFGCDNLESVVLSEGLLSIGVDAFSYCNKLTDIDIPDSVTSIGAGAFSCCSSLAKVVIPHGVTTINEETFMHCGALTEVDIPDTVTSIGDSAFEGCYNLASIDIPESVLTLGDRVFAGCYRLSSVVFENDATKLGTETFAWCDLREIVLPADITSIPQYTFRGCDRMNSFVVPEGVTVIEEGAFNGCSRLTSVTIPESVTAIEDHAFEYCQILIEVYNFSALNIECGSESFGMVAANAKDVYTTNEPSKLTTDSNGFIIYNEDALVCYVGAATEVTTPAGVSIIDRHAFESTQITSVTINDDVEHILYRAFHECTHLTEVNFGENSQLINIKAYAFEDCDALENITIPASVKLVESSAFLSCENLANIGVDPDNDTYKSIGGNLYSKDGTVLVKYAIGKTDNTFVIPEGVTTIGVYAFDLYATSYQPCNLQCVVVPKSVTAIEYGAFRFNSSFGPTNLQDIYYCGTEAEWDEIIVDAENDLLGELTIHYNYSPESN